MVDIASFKPTERKVEITHPVTGAPLGIRVTVMSINDDRLLKHKRTFRDEANRLASKGKHIKAEQEEANSYALLFAATTGWEWYNPTGGEKDKGYDKEAMPDFNGAVPEYNERNFKAVAKELSWFTAQLTAEIDEEKAFFTA